MTENTASLPFKVGLTGGIASGKSTVAELFSNLGVPVIDTDIVARDVVEPGQPALAAIAKQFGDSVISADGSLNRQQLREVVFSNEQQRRQLEAILHPVIRKATLQAVSEVSTPYCLIVVPLMFETGFNELVDHVVTVDVPEDIQRERLMARDNTNHAGAGKIIASQLSRDARNQQSHDHILNDGHPDLLDQQVHALHTKFMQLAASR